MKHFILILILFLFGCSEKYPWSDLSLDEALALKSDKIIFLDFYSNNWGGCVRLEAETLNSDDVLDFTKKHLIPIKLDAWYDTAGQELFKKYNGYAIPLLIFLNGEGQEIDRVVGYRNPDDFLEILNNVLNNDNTFLTLFDRYNQGDRSSDLIDKLSIKAEVRNDESLSSELYNMILNPTKDFNLLSIERAEFYFAKLSAKEGNLDKINSFISKYPNSENLRSAYSSIIKFYKSEKDTLREVIAHKQLIEKFSDNPSALNSYAWRMSELGKELSDALEKIDIALEVTGKDDSSYPNLLDTKAEVLWKIGFFDEAINVINEAISIDSNSEYYKEQKIKFENSKNKVNFEKI